VKGAWRHQTGPPRHVGAEPLCLKIWLANLLADNRFSVLAKPLGWCRVASRHGAEWVHYQGRGDVRSLAVEESQGITGAPAGGPGRE
jgi:hypothetical protein